MEIKKGVPKDQIDHEEGMEEVPKDKAVSAQKADVPATKAPQHHFDVV